MNSDLTYRHQLIQQAHHTVFEVLLTLLTAKKKKFTNCIKAKKAKEHAITLKKDRFPGKGRMKKLRIMTSKLVETGKTCLDLNA